MFEKLRHFFFLKMQSIFVTTIKLLGTKLNLKLGNTEEFYVLYYNDGWPAPKLKFI